MNKFKTITSIGSIGLVAVIVYLFWQVDRLKDSKANQIQEINQLHWMLSAKEAETDSIKDIGKYTEIDTVWRTRVRTRIDTLSGKVDTVYENIPDISGVIKIDTTKEYGPESNRLSVHVSGKFYYPEQYGYRNWLKIVPSFKKAPYVPVTPRSKSWSIGLNYSRSFNQLDYLGVSVRYKRFTVAPAYDPWHKTALMTVGFDILRF